MTSSMLHQSVREQFHIKHGGDDVGLNIDGWIVYPDGAMMGQSHLGNMVEPPTDPLKCSKIQLRYQQEKLRRAVRKFDERKEQLLNAAFAHRMSKQAPPNDSGLDELKRLQKIVSLRRKDVEAAKAEVEKHTPASVRIHETMQIENVEGNERFIAAVREMKV